MLHIFPQSETRVAYQTTGSLMLICCQWDFRACLRWNVESLICRRSLPACGRHACEHTCSPIARRHNTAFTVSIWKYSHEFCDLFFFFFLTNKLYLDRNHKCRAEGVKNRSRRGRCPPKQTHLPSYPSSFSLSLDCGHLISSILEAETCLHTLRLNEKDAFSRTKAGLLHRVVFP